MKITSTSKFVHNSSIRLCWEHHVFKTKLFGSRWSFLLNGISQPEHTITLSISITKWCGLYPSLWSSTTSSTIGKSLLLESLSSSLSLASFLFAGSCLCVGLLLLKVGGTLCHAFLEGTKNFSGCKSNIAACSISPFCIASMHELTKSSSALFHLAVFCFKFIPLPLTFSCI